MDEAYADILNNTVDKNKEDFNTYIDELIPR